MEKRSRKYYVFYVSVGLNFEPCQITWNLHAGSMVPDLACFALLLAHDHESVKKMNYLFLFCGKKVANTASLVIDKASIINCLPMLFLLAIAPNIFISLIFSLASWIIFHFQDGGDVTNPAGLSSSFFPRKCKSGPMPPSRAKNW